MRKILLVFSALISLCPTVLAGTLVFYKPGLDEAKFLEDYKTETGLPGLSKECSTCTVSGHYSYDIKTSSLTIVFYEALDPDPAAVWITSGPLTGNVTGQIATAVNNN